MAVTAYLILRSKNLSKICGIFLRPQCAITVHASNEGPLNKGEFPSHPGKSLVLLHKDVNELPCFWVTEKVGPYLNNIRSENY